MTRLVGDIGGTNARFALSDDGGEPRDERTLAVADHPGLLEAARAYLGQTAVDDAVIAVATPVSGDRISFTNSAWSFSIAALRTGLGVRRLAVINDFVAQALAVPRLEPDEVEWIGDASPQPGSPIGVLGPGTGLGMSALVPVGRSWLALPTEGGHASLAPASEREIAVLQVLARRFGHVSKERAISGRGLVNLAWSLATLDGVTLEATTAEQVVERARDGGCPVCREAVAMLSALLGAAAGDLALTLGAGGGVFIAGGVCLRLGDLFDRTVFRERFVAKGRLRPYLEAMPTALVLAESTGLRGATYYEMAPA